MCAAFGDDDVGKTVVNASGEEVGMVTAIEHGTARVKPDPGITDSIKAALGWEDTGDDTYPLQEDAIDRITGDEIRLSGELHGGTTAGTMDTGGEVGRESDAGRATGETGRRGDSEAISDDRTGRGDETNIDDEFSQADQSDGEFGRTDELSDDEFDRQDETDIAGGDERSVPNRDVADGRTESSAPGGPDDRPIDDEPGSTDAGISGTDQSDRGRGSSSARGGEEGEAMDPDVGDGDRVGGTDDELTNADREIRDGDTDSDSDGGIHDRDTDSDSDTDRS